MGVDGMRVILYQWPSFAKICHHYFFLNLQTHFSFEGKVFKNNFLTLSSNVGDMAYETLICLFDFTYNFEQNILSEQCTEIILD